MGNLGISTGQGLLIRIFFLFSLLIIAFLVFALNSETTSTEPNPLKRLLCTNVSTVEAQSHAPCPPSTGTGCACAGCASCCPAWCG